MPNSTNSGVPPVAVSSYTPPPGEAALDLVIPPRPTVPAPSDATAGEPGALDDGAPDDKRTMTETVRRAIADLLAGRLAPPHAVPFRAVRTPKARKARTPRKAPDASLTRPDADQAQLRDPLDADDIEGEGEAATERAGGAP